MAHRQWNNTPCNQDLSNNKIILRTSSPFNSGENWREIYSMVAFCILSQSVHESSDLKPLLSQVLMFLYIHSVMWSAVRPYYSAKLSGTLYIFHNYYLHFTLNIEINANQCFYADRRFSVNVFFSSTHHR